jgi:hypothetical protein
MNKDPQVTKKLGRSNSIVIPIATVIGLALIFLVYVFWYVSGEDKYYNDRAFRVLTVLSDSYAGKIRAVENVLGASTAYDAETAKHYVAWYLDEFAVVPDQVKTTWTHKCAAPSRVGQLSLNLSDSKDFSLEAIYTFPPPLDECKPFKEAGLSRVSAIIHPQDPLHSLFDELNEGFYEDILISDADGGVLYQQSTSGVRISDLNDLVRLRSDGTLVVPAADNSELLPKTGEKGGKDQGKSYSSKGNAADQNSGAKAADTKAKGPFHQISGSGNTVSVRLAGTSYQLYMQPSALAIQKASGASGLVFCGLRTAKHAQAETLSLPNAVIIWSALILPLIFALGWPLLKVFYVSPKERMQLGQLQALFLTILIGTVLLTLLTLNWSYTRWQKQTSQKHLQNVACQIKLQVHKEMARALAELNRLSTEPKFLSSLTANLENGWQEDQFFEHNAQSYLQVGHVSPTYPYFRYAVLIDTDGWQRAKFTAERSTPRVNAWKEAYFQEVRLLNLDEFVPNMKDNEKDSMLVDRVKFRLDLSISPNTGEFVPIVSVPDPRFAPETLLNVQDVPSKPNGRSPLQQRMLVSRFVSLIDPVLPPGFGFAVLSRDGKVQFHSISRRNLIEDFLQETQFNPELVSLLQQGGSDYFRSRYLGRTQFLYITPLETFQQPPLSLVVFRDDDRATAGNKAVVVIYSLLAIAYVLVLWAAVVAYFRWQKADYPLQGIWPTVLRQESYVRIGLTNLILFLAFFIGYHAFTTEATLYLALSLGVVTILFPLAEFSSIPRFWFYGLRALPFLYLIAMSWWSRGILQRFSCVVLVLALTWVLSWRFSRLIRSLNKDPAHRRKALKHTYTFVAISILVAAVVAPCIGFFKFAYEAVERRTVQLDQIEVARQLAKRQDRIHRYYNRINAPSLEQQRQQEVLDRYDLAFFNCLPPNQLPPSGGKPLKDQAFEEWLGDVAELFQSDRYSGLLELERAGIPREFEWDVSLNRQGDAVQSTYSLSGSTCNPSWIALGGGTPNPGALIVSALPVWPGFNRSGAVLLGAGILFLTGWIYVVTRRILLIDWRDSSELGAVKISGRILRSTIIVGHPKSGKSGIALRASQGYLIDIAELIATGKWDIVLPPDRLIIVDHFESGITDPALNMKKLELLERLDHVEHRQIILLSTVDPMFYFVSGFPEIVSIAPDSWSASVQVLDRWAALLSDFQKARFEDKSIRRFSQRLGVEQAKYQLAPENDRKSQSALMLINVVRQECDHTGILRKIGYQILLIRLEHLEEMPESYLHDEVMEDVLDRADAYYRSLWSTCTKDERLVLYQLAKDGWANPKNRKAIQDLKRRGLVVWDSGFHVMNRSFRQFVLDYEYPEEVAAWDQEIRLSTWRTVRNSITVAVVILGIWLIYSQQQVVHLALGYVGILGGTVATVASLIATLRNRSSRTQPGDIKSG